ncbi:MULTISPECIES: bifunctional YncE family protein/alkaline phosphatase family protein [Niastella]|uniref:Bifunctional YncE family protein/alkaline phosphatase family protein n=1 Tax=Niastella soli TaxID=2821487 RepID=A0ABS3YQI2_9BACT|nr:bifunctional YncE family protein/alkaline phosphatase family protein [Niastella soli]MBO9200068.1 bifunctional YncE family protein/alkaline phosphatase family protein [Niastella soli]
MRKIPFIAFLLCLLSATIAIAQPTPYNANTHVRVTLSNGWHLTPVGRSLPLGDLPLNLVVSPSKKYLAVTNNGQSVQSIQLIDAKTEQVLHSEVIPKSWYGLKFSADEKFLYASGGNDNWILQYAITDKKLVVTDSIRLGDKWPTKIAPAGIEIDDAKKLMYVVTRENNSIYIIDLATKKVAQRIQLSAEAYACQLSPRKNELYVSLWGGDKVIVFNTASKTITDSIAVGDNPNEICLTKNGKRLFVANANDNSVSVIDVAQRKVIETFNTALYPDAPNGSTTNGLALSANEKTLYIANADNNCLAVFDVTKPVASSSKGFIPTGWYPTNVKVIGKKIYVANGKGFSSMANPNGPKPVKTQEEVNYQQGDSKKPTTVQYIAGLFKGTLSIIDEPSEQQMSSYSKLVYDNTPYNKEKELQTQGEPGNPIPMKIGDASPIKYVFYVIKENRTYDQVLGDITTGNGDPKLVLFGEKYTPNLHALAKEFVLLDNFYVDGEVSADGHNWTMGGYATDYLEKTWPTSYGGRGGTYSAEGNREIANNKKGFFWDHCNRAGVSYRTYGEFADNYKPNIPVLKDHFCASYTGWDLATRDTVRFYQWKKDFDSLLAINQLPRFNSVRFGNDHTEGLRKGRPTPYAHVADNDLAVGMFIEYLSKSPIWKECAVFVIEDDAQNGADHVDAHRSTAYVAGGFVKRRFIDHTMYSTTSMLRTMELILGIPPMSQYDAAATPMWRCFTTTTDLTPFRSLPTNIDLNEKNVAQNKWQQRSEAFNLKKEDAVPDLEFNIVLWHGLKGDNIPFPGPKRAAFVKLNKEAEDDDD